MVVLASKSPRRAEVLRAAGIPFVVRPADVHEERRPGEGAADYVQRLALEKALAVDAAPGEVVLGADTTVVAGEAILEKPRDAEDARRMLELLSGRWHEVITGVCLRAQAWRVVDCSVTRVLFSRLTDAQIAGYVASGEPMDKAGAYAIQGLASKFIERIEGEYFNVVGLPVAMVYRYLAEFWPASAQLGDSRR
jgi:septum formation protein